MTGANTINEVPVLHARIISVLNEGCRLMIVSSKGVRAEIELFSCDNHPALQAGNSIVLERHGKGCYVYKGYDDKGNSEDFLVIMRVVTSTH